MENENIVNVEDVEENQNSLNDNEPLESVQEEENIDSNEPESTEPENEEEVEEQDSENKQQEPQQKKQNPIRRRIQQLTRRNRDLQNELETYRRQQSQPIENNNKNVTSEPDRDSFENDTDYIKALTSWQLEQRDRSYNEHLAKQNEINFKRRYADLEAKAIKEYPDFEDAIAQAAEDDIRVNNEIITGLRDSEYLADIQYYFAKNPDEAYKTLSMNRTEALRYLGRLEAKIEAKKASSKIKNSNAPKPIKPLKTSTGGNFRFDHNDSKTDIKSWMNERTKQLSKKRG